MCKCRCFTYGIIPAKLITTWVYSFHMPLFFLSTGILYGLRKQNNKRLCFNIKRKCNTILLPYFLWSTLYQVFISSLAIIGGTSTRESFIENLSLLVKLEGNAMWFLPAMFIASFIFFETVNNKLVNIFVVVILALMGLLVLEYDEIIATFLRSFVGLAYIAVGFYGTKIYSVKNKKIYILILFIIILLLIFTNGTVSIASRGFHNQVLYMINGCLGTFIVYQIAMYVSKERILSRLLKYWGENSIKILCLHGFVIQIIRLADYKFFDNILPVWVGLRDLSTQQ